MVEGLGDDRDQGGGMWGPVNFKFGCIVIDQNGPKYILMCQNVDSP